VCLDPSPVSQRAPAADSSQWCDTLDRKASLACCTVSKDRESEGAIDRQQMEKTLRIKKRKKNRRKEATEKLAEPQLFSQIGM